MTRSLLPASALFLLFVPGLVAQEFPPADELIDAYVEAIGGREVYLAPTSVRQVGAVTVVGVGLTGEFEILQVLPDRLLSRIELPGLGEILSGFDGEVGWSVNPLLGPSLMEGAELAQTAERAQALATLRDRSLVPERETVGREEIDGEACWRVRLTWASGQVSHDCFSAETGFLLETEESQSSQMGEVPVTTRYTEFRSFGSVTVPTRILQSSIGQEMEIRIREVEFDVVSPEQVEPPAAVRALVEGRTGS